MIRLLILLTFSAKFAFSGRPLFEWISRNMSAKLVLPVGHIVDHAGGRFEILRERYQNIFEVYCRSAKAASGKFQVGEKYFLEEIEGEMKIFQISERGPFRHSPEDEMKKQEKPEELLRISETESETALRNTRLKLLLFRNQKGEIDIDDETVSTVDSASPSFYSDSRFAPRIENEDWLLRSPLFQGLDQETQNYLNLETLKDQIVVLYIFNYINMIAERNWIKSKVMEYLKDARSRAEFFIRLNTVWRDVVEVHYEVGGQLTLWEGPTPLSERENRLIAFNEEKLFSNRNLRVTRNLPVIDGDSVSSEFYFPSHAEPL